MRWTLQRMVFSSDGRVESCAGYGPRNLHRRSRPVLERVRWPMRAESMYAHSAANGTSQTFINANRRLPRE
jgi:hypothetical protein